LSQLIREHPEVKIAIDQALDHIADFSFGSLSGHAIRSALKQPEAVMSMAAQLFLHQETLKEPTPPRIRHLKENIEDAIALKSEIERLTARVTEASRHYQPYALNPDDWDAFQVKEKLLVGADRLIGVAREIECTTRRMTGVDRGGAVPEISKFWGPPNEGVFRALEQPHLSGPI
jgi:hypothetical protein